MKKSLLLCVVIGAFIFSLAVNAHVSASNRVTLRSVINDGVLLTDIRDQFGSTIAQPLLNFGRITNSFECRSTDGALTASLGSDTQRIYVDNPKAAFDGWNLTIAAASGVNATWSGPDGNTLDYNDDQCSDLDGDGAAGQLTFDASVADINSDCQECDTDNIVLGTSSAKSFSESSSITLLRATSDSDELGRWYLTNIDVRQTVPPEQEGDTYEIDMVLTATAT